MAVGQTRPGLDAVGHTDDPSDGEAVQPARPPARLSPGRVTGGEERGSHAFGTLGPTRFQMEDALRTKGVFHVQC